MTKQLSGLDQEIVESALARVLGQITLGEGFLRAQPDVDNRLATAISSLLASIHADVEQIVETLSDATTSAEAPTK